MGRESDGTQQLVQKTIVGHLVAAFHQLTPALHFQVRDVRFARAGNQDQRAFQLRMGGWRRAAGT